MQLSASVSLARATSGRDNHIPLADAAIALQLAATGGRDPAADVDDDDRITPLDALMILQAVGGVIELRS